MSQNSSEIAPIYLDDVVLRRCSTMISLVDRIKLSVALRQVNSSDKIWLTISAASVDHYSSEHFSIDLVVPKRQRNRNGAMKSIFDERLEFNVFPKASLAFHLMTIFSHFKNFQSLTLNVYSVDFVVVNVLKICGEQRFHPTKMRKLAFGRKADKYNWEIIEYFSSFLNEIRFQGNERTETDNLENMWNSLFLCKNLEKIVFDESFISPLTYKCQNSSMEKMNISCFSFIWGMETHGYGDGWMASSWPGLKRRWLGSAASDPDYFLNECLHPERQAKTEDYRWTLFQDDSNSIIDLLCQALSATGYLRVLMPMATEISANCATLVKLIFKAISHWLKISNKTGRLVKLRLQFSNCDYPKDMLFVKPTNQAIEQLRKENSLSVLTVEVANNRTIIKYQNAKVLLSICNVDRSIIMRKW